MNPFAALRADRCVSPGNQYDRLAHRKSNMPVRTEQLQSTGHSKK